MSLSCSQFIPSIQRQVLLECAFARPHIPVSFSLSGPARPSLVAPEAALTQHETLQSQATVRGRVRVMVMVREENQAVDYD